MSVELDDYNCFFFFDPFEGELFDRVIDVVCKSLKRVPRKTFIIYINPRCYKTIEKNTNV